MKKQAREIRLVEQGIIQVDAQLDFPGSDSVGRSQILPYYAIA